MDKITNNMKLYDFCESKQNGWTLRSILTRSIPPCLAPVFNKLDPNRMSFGGKLFFEKYRWSEFRLNWCLAMSRLCRNPTTVWCYFECDGCFSRVVCARHGHVQQTTWFVWYATASFRAQYVLHPCVLHPVKELVASTSRIYGGIELDAVCCGKTLALHTIVYGLERRGCPHSWNLMLFR